MSCDGQRKRCKRMFCVWARVNFVPFSMCFAGIFFLLLKRSALQSAIYSVLTVLSLFVCAAVQVARRVCQDGRRMMGVRRDEIVLVAVAIFISFRFTFFFSTAVYLFARIFCTLLLPSVELPSHCQFFLRIIFYLFIWFFVSGVLGPFFNVDFVLFSLRSFAERLTFVR